MFDALPKGGKRNGNGLLVTAVIPGNEVGSIKGKFGGRRPAAKAA